MAQPQNKVDICNLALDHLKQASITTLTAPTSNVEKICERHYDNTRKAALRMHTWNFAMKRVILAEMVTTPIWGYSNQFQLPSDYIRIASIGVDNSYKDYAIENGILMLNETSDGALKIRYVFDNKSIETFDPLFVELLSLESALNISYPITGNPAVVARIQKMRDDKRREAFSVDGQERPPRRRERSRFKEARTKRGHYGSPYLED